MKKLLILVALLTNTTARTEEPGVPSLPEFITLGLVGWISTSVGAQIGGEIGNTIAKRAFKTTTPTSHKTCCFVGFLSGALLSCYCFTKLFAKYYPGGNNPAKAFALLIGLPTLFYMPSDFTEFYEKLNA